jgi:tetrahydromethanopterin S-methyltransferase subunit G
MHESNIEFRYVKSRIDDTNRDLEAVSTGKSQSFGNLGAEAGWIIGVSCLERAMFYRRRGN